MRHLPAKLWSSQGVFVGLLWVLVGTTAHAGDEIAYLAATDAYWQVWVVPASGGAPRQVTTSSYEKARISWYPDGRHLLVNALDGRVYRVDTATGQEEEIPMPLRGASDVVISPDGKQLAFSLSMAGSIDDNEIWVVDVGGDEPTRLTLMPYLQEHPLWSPDASWVYFLSGDGRQDRDIFRVSVVTKGTEQLTVGRRYHFELSIAQDGRLAFSNNATGDYEIYTLEEGAAPRRITDSPGLDGAPAWNPSGSQLAFHSVRDGASNVWRMQADGSAPVQLTRHPDGARDPVWAPAGPAP